MVLAVEKSQMSTYQDCSFSEPYVHCRDPFHYLIQPQNCREIVMLTSSSNKSFNMGTSSQP